MNSEQLVIAGIGTDVGKTVIAAIVAEALHAVYWKPIQAGGLEASDSHRVVELTKNVRILPELYRFTQPKSPHAAAHSDGIEVDLNLLKVPVERPLVIEGAGGLMVPINHNAFTFADLYSQWNLPLVLVSRHYLGSINHTLLTVEVLKQRRIPILGIVFIGDNLESESIILKATSLEAIATVPEVHEVDRSFVTGQAEVFAAWFKTHLHAH